jgi:phosphate transport system permease protein
MCGLRMTDTEKHRGREARVEPVSTARALGQGRDHHWGEFLVESAIRVLGFSAIGFVVLIFLFLLQEGLPTFFRVELPILFGQRWYPTFDLYGTMPLILGSVLVTIVAIAIALPLGVATAVFVREVAPNWAREILKPMIETLAGIPSVVLGFFGMTIVAPLVRDVLGAPTGLTAFTGALLLAYMSLPTIISVAEDALDAVPKSYRDAGLAMGATRWQTIWRVVVPAARSGIITAIMLGMGRAIGETMAVMMVTGNAARMPVTGNSLLRPVRTMTATIAAEMGEVARGSTHYHVLFGVGIILFVLTFMINLAAASVIFQKRRRGGLR